MATITANISITNDAASSSVSVAQPMTLFKAGGEEGMDTMTSVSKVLTSTNHVDLITATSVSTAHNYVYINNPSTNTTEYIHVTIGSAELGSGTYDDGTTPTEEIGRLYGGDWMFIPWTADTNEDIGVKPSVATKMVIEYMVFS
jgi:hypothetical protein